LQALAQIPSGQGSTPQAPAAEQRATDPNHLPHQIENQPALSASPVSQAPAPQAAQTGFPLDQFKEFSAIMTGGPLPGGGWDGHIYRSGNLMRMEARTRVPSYQITDLVKQETHGLAAGGCIFYKYPYTRSFPFVLSAPENQYERVPAGEETVDGHKCRVEDITITSVKFPHPLKLRLWEAEDLQGFPIKIETRTNAVHHSMQYKNVVLGPQDPTLFIYPDQCQGTEGMAKVKHGPAGSPKK
jgi:hypothetical protein